MKKFILLSIIILLLSTVTVSAADVYVMTERTSQGGIFEWYARMNTYSCGRFEESIEIVRVGKDRWTRKSPPSVYTIWFWKAEGLWFFSTKDHQTQKQGLIGTVKDNTLAKQVLKIVREYTAKSIVT